MLTINIDPAMSSIFVDDKDAPLFAEGGLFDDENEKKDNSQMQEGWKILIVDDEKDIHQVTKMVLRDFAFNNRGLVFISAYSGSEAQKLIRDNPDTALILLDVVMEEEDTGLKFVKYLREELNNKLVRVIIRTGQPWAAPPSKVAIDYDINDYKEKTELTKEKFFSTLVIALRSFENLKKIIDKL